MELGPGAFTNLDWLYEVRNGRGFMAGNVTGPTVGAYTEWQLFNPVASGVTIYVYRAWLMSDTTSRPQIREYSTALASLEALGRNLNVGGAAGVGQLRSAAPAALDGTLWGNLAVQANTMARIPGDWFAVLGAGEGILLTSGGTNQLLGAAFLWAEV